MNSKRSVIVLAAAALLVALPAGLSARMPEPADMPAALKGTEPHNPATAHYYLAELVKEGVMTPEEAHDTEVYLIFRNARRQQDLKEVAGMPKEQRRAVMKQKRALRGNPLVEYANYCGISLERAKVLMDAMHGSDKGDYYYEQAAGQATQPGQGNTSKQGKA